MLKSTLAILKGVAFMDNNSFNEKWINLAEVAEYIGVSKDTIRNWIKGSGMPAHKIGRLWKFKKSEIDLWVAKKESNSGY